MAGEILPLDFASAQPILERFMQEQGATLLSLSGTRGRPSPPRSLIAQPGSLEVLLTWNAPQIFSDIAAWRVYKDNENNLIQTINDAGTRQYTAKVPAATHVAFYISSMNALGRESIKVQIIAKANSDQYVTTGTGGGTSGSSASVPPGYPKEPSGGGSRSRNLGL